ncbi:MAG: CDP-glycerol glycerophosphotransferase family protein [Bacteroidales bacterium]|nr:CDP-glycerol glycerophosphotransferase family protein [Bacteroidales bacterium]
MNWEVIKRVKWRFFHSFLSLRVWQIRKKERIRFGFLLQELTQWKTESLYKMMLEHPRFEPILCISPSLGYPGAEKKLMDYCREKGYEFVWLDPGKTITEQLKLDFVTPEKPYPSEIHRLHQVDKNRSIPYVVIPYYLSTIIEEWVVNKRVNLMCWKQFVDNESCRLALSKIHRLKGKTFTVTGLPVMDELLTPKEMLTDIWPERNGKKRIIYAPHHTIADLHLKGISYATFLDYCDFMLEIRDKYKDEVYFVFKPHPSLRNKLNMYWGQEKTEAYYSLWNKPGVSHIEEGKYLSLFKHSDALIHDCASFTVEYFYADRPVMYLVRDDSHSDNMIPYAKEAFNLHEKGFSEKDIELFIQDVIEGKDPHSKERKAFFEKNLLPPHGKSACENIINAILGQEEYR